MLSPVRLMVAPLFAFALAAIYALAQPAPPAQPGVTPAPSCEKPADPPSIGGATELAKEAAERKRSNWSKNMKAYFECLKRFIDEQQSAAAPHIRAANAAVDEYNKAIKTYNEQVDAVRPQ